MTDNAHCSYPLHSRGNYFMKSHVSRENRISNLVDLVPERYVVRSLLGAFYQIDAQTNNIRLLLSAL